MDWQLRTYEQIVAALPRARVELHGSVTQPELLDGWSDLDLRVITDQPVALSAVLIDAALWAYEDVRTPESEVCRLVLTDGRRIDVSIVGTGRIVGLQASPDNDVRFLAALAAAKLGRGDRLIGAHLVLEILRSCLVLAMNLRDRDQGTTVHRSGSDRDRYADDVAAIGSKGFTGSTRPNVVEQAADLYARWAGEIDPSYVGDWKPLQRLIDRGES